MPDPDRRPDLVHMGERVARRVAPPAESCSSPARSHDVVDQGPTSKSEQGVGSSSWLVLTPAMLSAAWA